jgi:phytol kinase
MNLVIAVAVILVILCISEFLWRRRKIQSELTRKFVHISAGSFVAFWSLLLSRDQILLLSIAFVLVVAYSSYTQLFKAVHSVQRATWGEFMFAISVGTLALVAHSHWIFSVSLLIMSIADGLAAIIGIKYGRSNSYRIFGYTKSVIGTLTFFISAMVILLAYAIFVPNIFSFWFIGIAVLATVLENLAVKGLDNIIVPIVVAIALNVIR